MTAAGPWQDAAKVKPTREDLESFGFVLVVTSDGCVMLADYEDGDFTDDCFAAIDDVTHWARIVAPGEVSDGQ